MASRFRSVSGPTFAFLRSATRPSIPRSNPFSCPSPSPPSAFSRVQPGVRCVGSLLPLHSAVSAARLTSCIGLDSRLCRSLSQEMGLSVPR